MAATFKFDVFLSYSSKDRQTVRDLAERLKAGGLRVWFDEWAIETGDNIFSKIEEGLAHAHSLILCMSQHSLGSDWAALESQTFRFRDPLNKQQRFIPIRLDDVTPKGTLAQFKYVDWREASKNETVKSLVARCKPQQANATSTAKSRSTNLVSRAYSLGHTNGVRSVVLSADGRFAISGADDGTVRLWDLASGQCLQALEGDSDDIYAAAFDPPSQHAISGASDGTVRLWDLESGQCLQVLEGHSDSVCAVAFDPKSRRAVAGADDGSVRLWDLTSGQCLQVLEGHSGEVNAVAVEPKAQFAISGADDGTVRLWDLASGQCLKALEGHSGIVFAVAFDPQTQRAISGAGDGTVRLWDLASGQCLKVLEGHGGYVYAVAFDSKTQRAISGAGDGAVRLWDLASGQCLQVFERHSDSVWAVAFDPQTQRAISGAADGTVRLWDLASGRCLQVLEGHSGFVSTAAFDPKTQGAISGASDSTVRLWDLASGRCLKVLNGHRDSVYAVAFDPQSQLAISGAADDTVRLWDLVSGQCIKVLEGHSDSIWAVAFDPLSQRAISGASDSTVRLWDLASGQCIKVLDGHSGHVYAAAFDPQAQLAISGAVDTTVRLWDVASGQCLKALEGHSGHVYAVAFDTQAQLAVSGAADDTVRLWDLASGQCLQVLEGHSDSVWAVAFDPNTQRAISGAGDGTVRLWDLASGRCLQVLEGHSAHVYAVAFDPKWQHVYSAASNGVMRRWGLAPQAALPTQPRASAETLAVESGYTQYTNAKVLLVGDTSAGKTGLAHRLATGKWRSSEASTVGAWSTQWKHDEIVKRTLRQGVEQSETDIQREIWLWDFGGQADQRLIHQLFMERAALILLLFNSDVEDVLPGLRDWQAALRRCIPEDTPRILVAGRVDTGFRASRTKLKQFAQENGFEYCETSSLTGKGCDELANDITETIQWDKIEKRSSPRIFKRIKDIILQTRDAGEVLHTFKELRELLSRELKDEQFDDTTLRTVIGLLDGPGVVKELNYGTYILLQPEWVNAYAQAVIRTLRADDLELGALPLRSIAEGNLIYQFTGRDGELQKMKRLPEVEERVVLGEMERQLLEQRLCLQQGDKLVFPSHCGRDRPSVQETPAIFVSYALTGYLDDIYATLVVKLAASESFTLDELWRDAADFKTLDGKRRLGVKLERAAAESGKIHVYFGEGVAEGERVIFAKFIHAHLEEHTETVTRLRHYVCPQCNTPKGNAKVLMDKLMRLHDAADTECDGCSNRFKLWDDLERLFASDEVRNKVEGLREEDARQLDSRRKGKLLALDVGARITSADQKWHEIPQEEDEGIDVIMEFTDDDGKGTGKRRYLQLKAGNSHLTRRKKDGAEIFKIKEQRWVDYWLKQSEPVMLVIGTFDEQEAPKRGRDRLEFADVRWMEISGVLREKSDGGKKPVKQIEFKGEPMNLESILTLRRKVIGG